MTSGLSGLLHRLRAGKPIIVISGLPRSGTSMAMKMLEAGGVEPITDGIREADVDNPKGYYEDERVKDLAKMSDRSWLRQARGRAIKIISFLLKDLPDENDYRVVFMERDLTEVLASQQKMLDHRDEESDTQDEEMAEIYRDHLQHVKFMLGYRRHFATLFVGYRDVLADPAGSAHRINEFLGGMLDERAMAEVVDPELYRNRS